jgi:hypothetical protein
MLMKIEWVEICRLYNAGWLADPFNGGAISMYFLLHNNSKYFFLAVAQHINY